MRRGNLLTKYAAEQYAAGVKRLKIKKPALLVEKPKVELPLFTVRLPDGRWTTVSGRTRSEIRGQAKKDMKLERLPEGTTITPL